MVKTLTHEIIDTLRPGAELDGLVAQYVMDHPYPFRQCCMLHTDVILDANGHRIPQYSEDLAAIWRVFIAALCMDGQAQIIADMEDYGRGTFRGTGPDEVVYVVVGDWTILDVVGAAVCRAALHVRLDLQQGGEKK